MSSQTGSAGEYEFKPNARFVLATLRAHPHNVSAIMATFNGSAGNTKPTPVASHASLLRWDRAELGEFDAFDFFEGVHSGAI